jgi:NtrC-family two-component system response regulator AlgB
MLESSAAEHGTKTVYEAAWRALLAYAWPGNVRELRHAVSRAIALGGEELGVADFFPELRIGHKTPLIGLDEQPLQPYHALMRGAMEQALSTHKSIRAAAEFLGIPKSTFADRAKALGLLPRTGPRRLK